MKILMVADSIMLHLERDEAIAVAHLLDVNGTKENMLRARRQQGSMLDEIVRQIDICLNAKRGLGVGDFKIDVYEEGKEPPE